MSIPNTNHTLDTRTEVLNPYDSCVANKTINNKQCTVGWYVDENILSYVDTKVIDQVLATIEVYFPGLSIEQGNKLNFLGMEIDFFRKENSRSELYNT